MIAGPASYPVPIADIGELDPADYVGLIDETAVDCLQARLDAEGLLAPIWVRRNGNAAKKRYSVIAGRHRLLAAARLGWAEIAAEERAGPESHPAELRALQVAENLDRRTMRPIERSLFIMDRWRDAVIGMKPAAPSNQQGHAIRQRWSVLATLANVSDRDALAVDEAAAKACATSPRSVRRYRTLFAALVRDLPDLYAQLNAHPLGESLSAMTTLASIKMQDTRRKAAEAVLSRPDWANITEALVTHGLALSNGNRVDPRNHRAVMNTAFEAMKLGEKRAYLADFPNLLTKDMAEKLVINLVRVHKL